jgi:hypothetical protein
VEAVAAEAAATTTSEDNDDNLKSQVKSTVDTEEDEDVGEANSRGVVIVTVVDDCKSDPMTEDGDNAVDDGGRNEEGVSGVVGDTARSTWTA